MTLPAFKPHFSKNWYARHYVTFQVIKPGVEERGIREPLLLRQEGGTNMLGERVPEKWTRETIEPLPPDACGFQFVLHCREVVPDSGGMSATGLVARITEVGRSHCYFPDGVLFGSEQEVLKAFADNPTPILKRMWKDGWSKVVKSRHGQIYNGDAAVVIPTQFQLEDLLELQPA